MEEKNKVHTSKRKIRWNRIGIMMKKGLVAHRIDIIKGDEKQSTRN